LPASIPSNAAGGKFHKCRLANPSRLRRRGDRINDAVCCTALHSSGPGTKCECRLALLMSVDWGAPGLTGDRGFGPPLTPKQHERLHFAVMHNGPRDVVVYGRRPMGGLGETASHYNPQTSENAARQHDEAQARQSADGRAPSQFNPCRSATASQRSCPRTSGGARAADGNLRGAGRHLKRAWRARFRLQGHVGERDAPLRG
jgi:hypothetical protein